jgi:ribosomal protein S18 acetylase RimI-like enzyme
VLEHNLTHHGDPPALRGSLKLRQLEPTDRTAVLAGLDDWWERDVAGLVPRPFFVHFRDTSFAVERNGELVAFLVGFLSQTRPDEAYIHTVGVAPGERRNGIGGLLYRRFFAVAARNGRRRVRAVTSAVNVASIAFHVRLGFTIERLDEDEPDTPVHFVRHLDEDDDR